MEKDLPAFIAHRVRKLKTSPHLIEEIDSQPSPPPRPPAGKLKTGAIRCVSPGIPVSKHLTYLTIKVQILAQIVCVVTLDFQGGSEKGHKKIVCFHNKYTDFFILSPVSPQYLDGSAGINCRVATVREKYLENEIFCRSGKSQGILWMASEI